MYVRVVDGELHPGPWQDYELLMLRGAEDQNIVLAFRPGSWQDYASQFLRLLEDIDHEFEYDFDCTSDCQR